MHPTTYDAASPLSSRSPSQVIAIIVAVALFYAGSSSSRLHSSTSETMQCMQNYVSMMEKQTKYEIKRFRSDRGGEFKSHEFADYLKSKGIFHETSAPYISPQNGHAERISHTLKEKAEA